MDMNRKNLDPGYAQMMKDLNPHPNAVLLGGLTTAFGELLVIGADNPVAYAVPIAAGVLAYGVARLAGEGADKVEEYLQKRKQKSDIY